MKVVDIANEIYMELGELSSLSVPAIAFWLRTNLGNLNARLNTSYDVDSATFEIDPVMGLKEKDIFKKLYMIHYYDAQLRASLGAASTDTWVEISSDGTSVRRVNKIQQSQTYQAAKKVELEELEKLVHAYKVSASTPIQVTGTDTTEGYYSSNTTQIREKD
jgi:DNA-directed RNA polymerase specialized sigma subunit